MSHTAQAFDNELDIIKREIATMGELTLEMLSSAVESLSSGSAGQAYEIISRDHRIDELQRSVEGAEGPSVRKCTVRSRFSGRNPDV